MIAYLQPINTFHKIFRIYRNRIYIEIERLYQLFLARLQLIDRISFRLNLLLFSWLNFTIIADICKDL